MCEWGLSHTLFPDACCMLIDVELHAFVFTGDLKNLQTDSSVLSFLLPAWCVTACSCTEFLEPVLPWAWGMSLHVSNSIRGCSADTDLWHHLSLLGPVHMKSWSSFLFTITFYFCLWLSFARFIIWLTGSCVPTCMIKLQRHFLSCTCLSARCVMNSVCEPIRTVLG